VTDILRQRKLVSTTVIRKVNCTLGKVIHFPIYVAVTFSTVLKVCAYQLYFYYWAAIMEQTHYGLWCSCPYQLAALDLLYQGLQ